MKIMTVVGTRPEVIRLSAIISKLDTFFEHTLVHTGQNSSYELNEAIFDGLNVRPPDYFINCDVSSLGKTISSILCDIEPIIDRIKPDAAVILGDTNSCLSAIIFERMGIPVFHLEAGNRCFNTITPEEINRKIIDHTCTYNLAYTEHARRNLLAEGLPIDKIFVVGSPQREVINNHLAVINQSKVLEQFNLVEKEYFAASFHRQENIDNFTSRREILSSLCQISDNYQLPVIYTAHPRFENKLTKDELSLCKGKVLFVKPLNFTDWCCLQKNAKCVLSDSGTISEEAAILGFQAVTPRISIERPEAKECGSIIHCQPNSISIIKAVNVLLSRDNTVSNIPESYKTENTSDIVISILLSIL